jgi:hypothetical protein
MTVVLAILVTTGLATLVYVSIKSHLDGDRNVAEIFRDRSSPMEAE